MALLGLSTDGQRLHWRLCSRIINTYRKRAKDGFQIKEPSKAEKKERQQKEQQQIKEICKRRLYSKRKATFNQNQGSRKNARVFNALKPVIRLTSGGKKRPSRNKKIQFVSVPITYHLKGSKYTGGHQLS